MHGRRAILRAVADGRDLIARLQRILFPAEPGQGRPAIAFGNPFFDLTLVGFCVEKDLRMWIDELKVRHNALHRGHLAHVVYCSAVVRERRTRREKIKPGNGKAHW